MALRQQQVATIDALCADGHPIVAMECAELDHTETVQATLDLTLALVNGFAAGGQPEGEVCGAIAVIDCG